MKNLKSRTYKAITVFLSMMCIISNIAVFASGTSGWPTSGNENIVGLDENVTTLGGQENTQQNIAGFDETQVELPKDGGVRQDVSALINHETTADAMGDKLASDIYNQYSDVIPDVDIDDVISWSNRKGFEIIKFLQTFIQPFAIIIFMLAAIFVLVGSLGNSQIATKGLWGMIASCICYAAVLYAPSILSFVVGWLAS